MKGKTECRCQYSIHKQHLADNNLVVFRRMSYCPNIKQNTIFNHIPPLIHTLCLKVVVHETCEHYLLKCIQFYMLDCGYDMCSCVVLRR